MTTGFKGTCHEKSDSQRGAPRGCKKHTEAGGGKSKNKDKRPKHPEETAEVTSMSSNCGVLSYMRGRVKRPPVSSLTMQTEIVQAPQPI